MNRCHILLLLIATMCLSCGLQSPSPTAGVPEKEISIETVEKAAEFAARLANERCQHVFGASPFTPESYSATLEDSRWHWGKIEPPGINGFSAEIEFNTDSSERYVRVVYHTDQSII